jgi:1-acyl-sn-glycerol-3-phosphate acyltransferase
VIPLKLVSVFLKTAESSIKVLNLKKVKRLRAKKDWAEMVLKTFDLELTVVGNPPKNGACLLVGNHISYFDIPALMAARPEVTFIAKRDILLWPIIGSGAAAAGTIFVKRAQGSDRRSVRNRVLKGFKEENQIVVFPSGTTTLTENKLWKKGIFEIAKEAGVPIQLFRLEYELLREAAYIDDDQLFAHMKNFVRLRRSRVTLRWLERYAEVTEPQSFAEELRKKVQVSR